MSAWDMRNYVYFFIFLFLTMLLSSVARRYIGDYWDGVVIFSSLLFFTIFHLFNNRGE